MPLILEELTAGRSVRFSPSGISMRPMLREGIDSVVLSPLPQELKKYDIPLYKRSNGQYVLHRIVKVDAFYTCIGDNQYYKETGLRQEQMIAVVTAFTRNGKEISVSHNCYRLYCRIWHYSRPFRHLISRIINKLRRHFK